MGPAPGIRHLSCFRHLSRFGPHRRFRNFWHLRRFRNFWHLRRFWRFRRFRHPNPAARSGTVPGGPVHLRGGPGRLMPGATPARPCDALPAV
ncbi:hypothetical protein SSP531S_43270 [Streptomyces spongiicola]|uniref:Uncharacterized protein n=1 Tax=Streptomyces spongiicola TaxID=1690221 RepID=A0A388T1N8_9ACTN|nr:hypothetical protein SSP531S_43270 [Streptomyces spongiicola]